MGFQFSIEINNSSNTLCLGAVQNYPYWSQTNYKSFSRYKKSKSKTCDINKNLTFSVPYGPRHRPLLRGDCGQPQAEAQRHEGDSQGTLIKKKIKIFSFIMNFRMEQLQSHIYIWLTAFSYMVKYLPISTYIRKPLLIYDFAFELPYIWGKFLN